MSHTHPEHLHFLRALTGGVLVTGIVIVMTATSQVLTGQVSSQGSTLLTHPAAHEATLDAPAFHSASFIPQEVPGLQGRLLLGMLLILLGFAFYTAWFVRQEQFAAVHAKTKRKVQRQRR